MSERATGHSTVREWFRFGMQASVVFGLIALQFLAMAYFGVLMLLIVVDAILFGEAKFSAPLMDAGIALLDWLGDTLFLWTR